MILQRAGPPAAGSLRRNALARRNVRSNARAAGRHRRKLCRDTRSALRGNALRCRARLRRRKQHGPEGAAAEMVEWLAAARECPAVRNLGGSFFLVLADAKSYHVLLPIEPRNRYADARPCQILQFDRCRNSGKARNRSKDGFESHASAGTSNQVRRKRAARRKEKRGFCFVCLLLGAYPIGRKSTPVRSCLEISFACT